MDCVKLAWHRDKIYSRRLFPCWGSHTFPIYSCFDKGCPTTAQKRTRQFWLVLWVVIVWRYLVKAHGVQLEGKRRQYACLCCSLLSRWNTLRFNQSTVKPPSLGYLYSWSSADTPCVYSYTIEQIVILYFTDATKSRSAEFKYKDNWYKSTRSW